MSFRAAAQRVYGADCMNDVGDETYTTIDEQCTTAVDCLLDDIQVDFFDNIGGSRLWKTFILQFRRALVGVH